MTPAPIAEADPDGISTVASRKNLSTCGQNYCSAPDPAHPQVLEG